MVKTCFLTQHFTAFFGIATALYMSPKRADGKCPVVKGKFLKRITSAKQRVFRSCPDSDSELESGDDPNATDRSNDQIIEQLSAHADECTVILYERLVHKLQVAQDIGARSEDKCSKLVHAVSAIDQLLKTGPCNFSACNATRALQFQQAAKVDVTSQRVENLLNESRTMNQSITELWIAHRQRAKDLDAQLALIDRFADHMNQRQNYQDGKLETIEAQLGQLKCLIIAGQSTVQQ